MLLSRKLAFLFLGLSGLCLSLGSFAFDFGTIDLNRVLKKVEKLRAANTEIAEPQEIALGEGIASNLLGAAPLLDKPKLQRYVNLVGRWLVMQTERPDLPWQFIVLDDNAVNAFAVPGGYVFVTRGMLARLHSEAELAGVLAHEVAHVLRKHYLEAIKKGAQTELLAEFANETITQMGSDPKLQKLISAGTEIYARGLDKADELEADRMAVVIAARAGYDPYGLPAVLQALQSINPQDSDLALLFKTHPAPAERLNSLENFMSPGLDRFERQPALAKRFAAVLAGARK